MSNNKESTPKPEAKPESESKSISDSKRNGSFCDVKTFEFVGTICAERYENKYSVPGSNIEHYRSPYYSQRFARKYYLVDEENPNEGYRYGNYLREYIIMNMLSEWNVFPMLYSNTVRPDMVIDMEWFPTTLHEVAHNNKLGTTSPSGINWQTYLVLQMGSALGVLQDIGIQHGDIKPDNILYDPKRYKFVLCDFNKSMLTRLKPKGDSWCEDFAHPTLRKNKRSFYGYKFDWWSMAATIWYGFTKKYVLTRAEANRITVDVLAKYKLNGPACDYVVDLFHGKNTYKTLLKENGDHDLKSYAMYPSQYRIPSNVIELYNNSLKNKIVTRFDIEEYTEEMENKDYGWLEVPKLDKRFIAITNQVLMREPYFDYPQYLVQLYFITAVLAKDNSTTSLFNPTPEVVKVTNEIMAPLHRIAFPCAEMFDARKPGGIGIPDYTGI